LSLVEFLGNHDVKRLASKLSVDAHTELAQAALVLAVGGMPCLYYGDEYGMKGAGTKDGGAANDADLRKVPPSSLDETQRRKFKNVQAIVECRKMHPVLATGDVAILGNSNEQMAIVRRSADGAGALVLFNCSDSEVQTLPPYVNLNTGVLPSNKILKGVLSFSNGEQVPAEKSSAKIRDGKLELLGSGMLPNSVSVYIL